MINNFGSFEKLTDAAVQPDKNLDYKMIFSITKKTKKEEEGNPGLVHIARTINIYEWAGIPAEKLQMVAIVHGKSTVDFLSEDAFQHEFQKSNRNTDLINQLAETGVKIFICGQSLLRLGYERDVLNPNTIFALSALTVLPTYQLRGYALLTY